MFLASAGPSEPVLAASLEVALRATSRGYLGARTNWWGSEPSAAAIGLYYSSGPWRGKYAEVGVVATSSSFGAQHRTTRGGLAFGGGFLLGLGHRAQLAIGGNLVRDPVHSFASLGVTLWLGDSGRPPNTGARSNPGAVVARLVAQEVSK